MARRLVDRWRLGAIPLGMDKVVPYLSSKLKSLERTLDILHPAIEHPVTDALARVTASSTTTINSTSAVLINGCSLTITTDVETTLLVQGVFDVRTSVFAATTNVFVGELFLGGVAEATQAIYASSAVDARSTITQVWRLSLMSGTQYTLELKGRTTNTLNQFVVGVHSGIIGTLVPVAYRGLV